MMQVMVLVPFEGNGGDVIVVFSICSLNQALGISLMSHIKTVNMYRTSVCGEIRAQVYVVGGGVHGGEG